MQLHPGGEDPEDQMHETKDEHGEYEGLGNQDVGWRVFGWQVVVSV